MTEVDIVIEAEGQLGYRKVSDVEGLKNHDLIEVRTVQLDGTLSEDVSLAMYRDIRCSDEMRDESCEGPGCCTYVVMFGTEYTWSPDEVAFIRKVKVVAADAETVARRFHEAYERLAPDFGHRTREASAKPWDEVPEQNRALMVATVAEVLNAQ